MLPVKTKYSRYSDEPTAAQDASRAEDADEHTATMRFVCTLFRFWRVCPHKACRRAHTCGGDPHACFARWWRHVPQEVKVLVRAGITARCAGLDPQEAARAARAEVARWRELEKRHGEPDADAGSASTAPATTAGAAPDDVPEPMRQRMAPRVRLM